MEEYRFIIDESLQGERLDKCIPLLLDSVSRSYIQNLIKSGQVFLNNKPAKGSSKVSVDDEISFSLPEAETPDIQAKDIPLDILYEDQDVIIINKPKGMVVHPAPGHYDDTMVNALMYHCKDGLSGINGVLRPGIVHRIDRDTTGSVIACKNDAAHNSIAEQLKVHSIHRLYRAIVIGVVKEDEGTINKPIGRHKEDRKKMAITPDGKTAITHYKVLERFKGYTYIECKLETGRTHQIRVHMASIGHPLLGDSTYTKATWPFSLQGQCLHAYILGFVHPSTEEYIETVAPLPEYFEKILKILRDKNN